MLQTTNNIFQRECILKTRHHLYPELPNKPVCSQTSQTENGQTRMQMECQFTESKSSQTEMPQKISTAMVSTMYTKRNLQFPVHFKNKVMVNV